MKKNLNRLMSLVLGLVLFMAILPVTRVYAASYSSIAAGTYTIASKADESFLLDVYGDQTVNKANVQVYKKANNATQQFSITKTGGGWYSITPRSNSSLAITVEGSPKNKANVRLETYTGKVTIKSYTNDDVKKAIKAIGVQKDNKKTWAARPTC